MPSASFSGTPLAYIMDALYWADQHPQQVASAASWAGRKAYGYYKRHKGLKYTGSSIGKTARRSTSVAAITNAGSNIVDNDFTNVNVYSTPNITNCTVIAEGDTQVTRNAYRIHIKGIEASFNVICGTTQARPQSWHIMLVRDKRPRGADPAVTDVLRSTADYSVGSLEYGDRFEILMHRYGMVSGDGDALGGIIPYRNIHKTKKLNFDLAYEPAEASGGTNVTTQNPIFCMIWGSCGLNDTTAPLLNGTVRVIWSEKHK